MSQDIHATVRESAEKALKGDYFKLFSRANAFLYPRSQIAASVLATSPRIEEVEVKRSRLNSLVISIKEKAPAALVCVTFPDFDAGEIIFPDGDECSFADEEGFLYKGAPALAGTMYNRYYIPELASATSSSGSRLGLYATSTSEFHNLQHFYQGLKKNEIEVYAILFKAGGEYEAYIKNPGGADAPGTPAAVIYFNNARPLTLQLENLILFWNHAKEEMKAEKRIPVYEYIDVRYGPNVFFREVK